MPRGVPPAALIASLLALVVIAGSAGSSATAGSSNGNGANVVPPEIQADFDADGVVEVIVALENDDVLNALRARTGNGRANGQAQRDAAQEFKGRNDQVVAGLPTDAASVERYDQFGAFSLTVTDQRVLDLLTRHPLVKGLEPVREVEVAVAQSMPFINQPAVATAGITGAGTSVAIIDTGISYTVSFFGSCTSPGVPAGTCRVPFATDFAPEDGSNDAMGHGTNVAGIAGSVAPGTSLLSLDVFNGNTASTTDILEGLNWVIANAAAFNTKSVNLSLGGAVYSSQSSCDAQSSATLNAFTTLRANGVLPAVASGNNASKNGVTWPGCVTGAHAVGAVYDADYGPRNWNACTSTTTPDDATTAPDKVTCFSNSHSTLLDSLAPGTFIDVAGTINFSGTSMAAPHVAGAAAVLGALPATVTQIESALTTTGPQVTDLNNVTKHRLDLLAATNTLPTAAPVFASTPPTSVVVGEQYLYHPFATGNPSPTLSLVDPPAGMTLSPFGLLSWTPTAGQAGEHEITIEATNSGGTTPHVWTIDVTVPPPVQLYFALQNAQTLNGVSMADEDIVFFDGATFSRFFDGSTQGIGSFVIDAFDIVSSNEILFSFTGTGSVDGVSFDDSDVLKFTASTGVFTMYFDASDVGLASSTFGAEEDVDAVQLREDGHLIVSTNSNFSVTGVSGVAQDLIRFIPTSTGPNTAGTWAMYWDGSDATVGLTQTGENIDGASLADGDLYLSTSGDFSVGVSGDNKDVFVCRSPNPGGNSNCGLWELFFDGSDAGIGGTNNVNAIDIPDVPVAPNITSAAPETATVGVEYSYQATASGTTPITWSLDGEPSGMNIDANSGLVTWTPVLADVGLSPHDVTIEATNSAGSDSQPWQITVSPPPAPDITSTPGLAATVDVEYSYQAAANGAPPITWELTTAPAGMVVNGTGLVTWTPDSGDVGDHNVVLEATNDGGTDAQPWTVSVGTAPPVQFYFTIAGSTTLGGVNIQDDDVVAYHGGTNYSLFFDGGDVGIGSLAIDALEIIDSDEMLLSFATQGSVPGIGGTTDDSDIVRFTGTFGTSTSGTFSMFFDGSDVGLDQDSEDVDALHRINSSRIALSTTGSVTTSSGFTAVGQDLIRFIFADGSGGENTAGTWRLWWDGSDVGLTNTSENLDAASLSAGKLYLSATGAFAVTGASGGGEDIFVCESPTTLDPSACGLWSLFLDGSALGLSINIVAVELP